MGGVSTGRLPDLAGALFGDAWVGKACRRKWTVRALAAVLPRSLWTLKPNIRWIKMGGAPASIVLSSGRWFSSLGAAAVVGRALRLDHLLVKFWSLPARLETYSMGYAAVLTIGKEDFSMKKVWTTHAVLDFLFGGNLITGTIKTLLWVLAFCVTGASIVHYSLGH